MRLKLSQMLTDGDVEQTTDKIRKLKHSKLIRADILNMNAFKRKYKRLSKTNNKQYKTMAENKFFFLYKNYTNIFHRFLKGELDIKILLAFLKVLEQIEEEELDQHEGSYQIGVLLKKLYIDSALRQDEKRSKGKKGRKAKKKKSIKNLTWEQYKMMQLNE